MEKITKQQAWQIIKRDKFLKLLATNFGCAGFQQKGKRWTK